MDKREQILNRLHQIVAGIAGVTAERNRTQWDDTQLPAVSVLEGDETVDEPENDFRPSTKPHVVKAMPQIYIQVKNDDPGTPLNALRAQVIRAVLFDTELNRLAHRHIRYAGQSSKLHAAREMVAVSIPVISIPYLLVPSEL